MGIDRQLQLLILAARVDPLLRKAAADVDEYIQRLQADLRAKTEALRAAVAVIPGSHQSNDLLLRRKASLPNVPAKYDIGEMAEIDAILMARAALGVEG